MVNHKTLLRLRSIYFVKGQEDWEEDLSSFCIITMNHFPVKSYCDSQCSQTATNSFILTLVSIQKENGFACKAHWHHVLESLSQTMSWRLTKCLWEQKKEKRKKWRGRWQNSECTSTNKTYWTRQNHAMFHDGGVVKRRSLMISRRSLEPWGGFCSKGRCNNCYIWIG